MALFRPNALHKVIQYIEELPDFSKDLCIRLREIILAAEPQLTEEWKWGPHYSYHGMVCGFGAAKKHVKLTFFNGSAMKDKKKLFNHCTDNAFSRSIQFTSLNQIDESAITAYVRESVQINKKGFKRVISEKIIDVPEEIHKALQKNKTAEAFFNELSYGYKKDFVEWVTSAKRETTRLDRIEKIVKMCEQGIKLNEKYKK